MNIFALSYTLICLEALLDDFCEVEVIIDNLEGAVLELSVVHQVVKQCLCQLRLTLNLLEVARRITEKFIASFRELN